MNRLGAVYMMTVYLVLGMGAAASAQTSEPFLIGTTIRSIPNATSSLGEGKPIPVDARWLETRLDPEIRQRAFEKVDEIFSPSEKESGMPRKTDGRYPTELKAKVMRFDALREEAHDVRHELAARRRWRMPERLIANVETQKNYGRRITGYELLGESRTARGFWDRDDDQGLQRCRRSANLCSPIAAEFLSKAFGR